MRGRTWLGLVGALATSATLVAAVQKAPLVVPLSFKPQDSTLDAGKAVPGAMLDRSVEIRVEDGRAVTDKALIGEGPDGETPFAIQAKGDVLGFIKATAASLAGSRGLKISTPGDRQLRVRLTRFWVKETHRTVGSIYAAEAIFAYTLTDNAGGTIFDSTASAAANRYGRARNTDNCMEVLSDALKEAILSVFADPKLQAAWAGTGATPAAASAAAVSDRRPVDLKIGMTEPEAIAALGQPVRRITMTDRTLLQYTDLVLTIVGGKVTDIQVK